MTLLTRETAREPTIRSEQLRVLDEVVQWIDVCTKRVFVEQPKTRLALNTNIDVWQNILFWSDAAEVKVPQLLTRPHTQDQHYVEQTETIVYYAGDPISGHRSERVENVALSPSGVSKRMLLRSQFWDRGLDRHTDRKIYRSIFRYIERHLLGRERKWAMGFASKCDADYIEDKIRKSETALRAYALMLFWMHVEEKMSLRLWFDDARNRRPSGHFDMRLQLHNMVTFGDLQAGSIRQAAAWVEFHAKAAILWSTWKSCLAETRKMARDEYVRWGDGIVEKCGVIQWSAGYGADHRLRFRLEQVHFPIDFPKPRREKDERRLDELKRSHQIRQNLTDVCAKVCFRKLEQGTWYPTAGAIAPVDLLDSRWLKRHRLLLHTYPNRVHYYLFPLNNEFIARCVEVPVEAHAYSTKEVVNLLRGQVTFFLRVGS